MDMNDGNHRKNKEMKERDIGPVSYSVNRINNRVPISVEMADGPDGLCCKVHKLKNKKTKNKNKKKSSWQDEQSERETIATASATATTT
jgi:hypothetical protein